ncbi:MAG: polysaccharide deacetylase family protein [Nitrospiraceae bacterium]|nr:polysaccharide deacetylase family protein [Nitrospiraceae bacterium]
MARPPPPQFYFTIYCDWVPGSHVGLEMLLAFCDRTHFKGTIFFAGRFAEAYPHLVRDCHDHGHQLGTHGWAHGGLEDDEDFRTASYEQQREWIRRATEAAEQAAGIRPVVFRAPNLSIGETTLRALEHEGYRYDSSVPARRFDMGFGRVHYLKYFWAPRDPYRPSEDDLTTPGENPLIEVPPVFVPFSDQHGDAADPRSTDDPTHDPLDRPPLAPSGLLLSSLRIRARVGSGLSGRDVQVELEGHVPGEPVNLGGITRLCPEARIHADTDDGDHGTSA